MKTQARFLASLFALAFLGGCGDSTSPNSKVSPVVMSTPSGWTRQDNYSTSGGTQLDFMLKSPAGTGIVMVLTTARSSMTADQAIQEELTAFQSQFPGMVVDSNLTRSVAGYPARILEFHMIQSGTNITEKEVVFQTASNDVQVMFTRVSSDAEVAATMLGLESQIRIQ